MLDDIRFFLEYITILLLSTGVLVLVLYLGLCYPMILLAIFGLVMILGCISLYYRSN